MMLSNLEGKKVLILGYAREGKASEAFLKKYVPSAMISIADQATDPKYLERQTEADVVVKTPAIPKRLLTKLYTTGTNLFFQFLREKELKNVVVGVTGSKGKSTTVSLIAAILREAGRKVHLIGNIGNPALSVLLEPIGKDDVFVIELSSYQLDDVEYSPNISVITSIFTEHLDYHEGFENYFSAKAKIIARATDKDFYVYNPRYPRLAALSQKTDAQPKPFVQEIPFDVSSAKLQGEHNLDNIRAALTVSRLLNVKDPIAAKAILKFEPLPHRMTNIGTFRGVTFIDDAISTAPESTMFALQTIKNVDTIFLGGTDRGYDFAELADLLVKMNVRNIVLFPTTGVRIEEALSKAGGQGLNFLRTESMEEAVRFAYKHTEKGKACLLSTASPSYSLWKNFEQKGEEFERMVKDIGDRN